MGNIKSQGVYKGKTFIGSVTMEGEEVILTVYANQNGIRELTRNDMDIIWDNWDTMLDQVRQKTS
jgi:hypothetical protein